MSSFLPFVIVGLTTGSLYGLAGTGLVLTYRTSGIFNFAHGTVAALAAYAFYDLHQLHDLPWPAALSVCLFVFCPLVGLGLERIAAGLAEAPVALKVVATVGLVVGVQQAIFIHYGVGSLDMHSFLPTHAYRVGNVAVGQDQLVVIVVSLFGMLALTWLFELTPSGRRMRAVVEQPELLAMAGTPPTRVRRQAWLIGTIFAGLSGILLAPAVGLDASLLTLLVVQAFGAAAVGMFRSLPLTYAGGLIVGVLGALATKYVATMPSLSGLPSGIPFIVLFLVLVAAPARWLVEFSTDQRLKATRRARSFRHATPVAIGAALVAWVWLPSVVGVRLPVYTSALAYVMILLSLALLMRTSGQVSLAQMSFAAVGSATSARLAVHAGLPWLLAVLAGAAAALPVGAILALPAIRRSGLYLALATFGFAVLFERVVYNTNLMFGLGVTSLPAPRPGFADSDSAYFRLVLVVVVLAVAFIALLQRSRLGRLLRAMADSTTALNTYGMSVTVIKLVVFCVAAFLAGLGGALLGPVSRNVSATAFGSFSSLQLLVVLALIPTAEVSSSVIAAALLVVLPSYIQQATVNDYLPLVYGASAVLVGTLHSGLRAPTWLTRVAQRARPAEQSGPIRARLRSDMT